MIDRPRTVADMGRQLGPGEQTLGDSVRQKRVDLGGRDGLRSEEGEEMARPRLWSTRSTRSTAPSMTAAEPAHDDELRSGGPCDNHKRASSGRWGTTLCRHLGNNTRAAEPAAAKQR